MTDVRLTQDAVEVVWADSPPTLITSQNAIEIIWYDSTPTLSITQDAIEVVWYETKSIPISFIRRNPSKFILQR